ncbi:urease accessory protein UreF [Helicobacter acinonychis]|uniref:Urease accessory protein UreF n=1 Tax=Helicobacter acinonychis (strain Sheeba) TaxID=382638 RepID=Q17VS3_HELAH|nr:urease accessory protein UreF [Helicobacter acinonychis]CAK00253.1 ureF [Helicobacter acinonychis str. Sheeba]STP03179.1 ureF family protein [Helicobacter acinonychis]STP09968.1 ureF family protein [Helicobacter acinonychis]
MKSTKKNASVPQKTPTLEVDSKHVDNEFLILQVNDAVFPIGSYTHSFGLETYIQQKKVTNKESALEYLKANLSSQFLYTEMLSLKLTYESALQNDLNKILEIEEIIALSTSPMELRLANQKLGNRFIKTLQAMNELDMGAFFNTYAQKTKDPIHATSYGVFVASLNIELKKALRHYLYAQTSNMVINCVKSVPLSQNDGQKILLSLQSPFNRLIEKTLELDESHLCVASIQNDIKAMQHESLYSRLYMS